MIFYIALLLGAFYLAYHYRSKFKREERDNLLTTESLKNRITRLEEERDKLIEEKFKLSTELKKATAPKKRGRPRKKQSNKEGS